MSYEHKRLNAAIVLNLILWMMMLGTILNTMKNVREIAWVGVTVAAFAQHWGYYLLRKENPKVITPKT